VNMKKRNIVKPNIEKNVILNTRKNVLIIMKMYVIMKTKKNVNPFTLKNVNLLIMEKRIANKSHRHHNVLPKRKRNVTKYQNKLVKMFLKKNAKKSQKSIVTNIKFPNAERFLNNNALQLKRKSVRMSQFKYQSKNKNPHVSGQAPGQTMMIPAASSWQSPKQTNKSIHPKLFVEILIIFLYSIGISNCKRSVNLKSIYLH
jgi:hypothetical protein